MSHTVSIFFSCGRDSQCKELLEDALSCKFVQEGEDGQSYYSTWCLGLHIVWFRDHGMVNNSGILFEDYDFELDVVVPNVGIDAYIAIAYQRAAARYIYEMIVVRLGWEAALVDNFQRLLAVSP